MNTERLEYLLHQYVQKSSTQEELVELFGLIAAEKNREELAAFMDSRLEDQIPHIRAKDIDWDFMFNRIIQKPPHTSFIRRYFLQPKKIAIAAAFLLLLSGSIIFWRLNRPVKNDHIAGSLTHSNLPEIKDIPPGHNGALLTLADGKQIVLDSAQNGALSSQGTIKIMKQGGVVAYSGQEPDDNTAPGTVKEPAAAAMNVMSTAPMNVMSTPRGRQYQLILADGSKVWLNSASSIRFPTAFTGDRRSVEISGEVYFEIARDEKRPFDVIAKDMDIRVLGTHFNVNSYSDEHFARVTLLEGAVKIAGAKKEGQQDGQEKGQHDRLYDGQPENILRPGQQAIRDNVSGKTRVISDVNTEDVMAWKNGWFSFDNADLKTVMRQLARWYDVDIVYANDVPEEHFTGEIDCNLSLARVLKILEKTHVHFRIEENRRIMILPG